MKEVHILLVEDNEGDILLTTEALQEGKIINRIDVVRDGKKAMDFLTKEGEYKQANTPDIIVLDVNLPKKNGHEVLHFIKNHQDLKHIPVIMLTTSSAKSDINKSYENHANCYITKPVDSEGFMKAIKTLEDFWIHIVKLPSN
jgi:CheY-like chemotaxis protein